jgi:hypothetical protein
MYLIFKIAVLTSKKTLSIITKFSPLIVLREKFALYSQSQKTHK